MGITNVQSRQREIRETHNETFHKTQKAQYTQDFESRFLKSKIAQGEIGRIWLESTETWLQITF